MASKYKRDNKSFWNKILKGKKYLSEKEAEEMYAVIRSLRDENGFR